MRSGRYIRLALVSLAVGAVVGWSQPGQAEEEGPNQGRVSLSVGNDITTAYFFRGIVQERHGLIWQPYGTISLNLYSDDDGAITSIDAGFGVWASYHSRETLSSGSGPDPLYEVDYYPSLDISFAGGLSTGLNYYFYTSPNGAFNTVGELSWHMAFDDSGLISDNFSLQPSAEIAFEMDNTSFGNGKGIFAGINLAPNFTVDAGQVPVTFTAPLKLGLSADEYYYNPSAGYDDDNFGFFMFGLNVGFPITAIPEDFGTWSFVGGCNVYVLGDNLEKVNDGDSPYPVGTISLNLAY